MAYSLHNKLLKLILLDGSVSLSAVLSPLCALCPVEQENRRNRWAARHSDLVFIKGCNNENRERQTSGKVTWSSLLRCIKPVVRSRSPPKVLPVFCINSHSSIVLMRQTNSSLTPAPSLSVISTMFKTGFHQLPFNLSGPFLD